MPSTPWKWIAIPLAASLLLSPLRASYAQNSAIGSTILAHPEKPRDFSIEYPDIYKSDRLPDLDVAASGATSVDGGRLNVQQKLDFEQPITSRVAIGGSIGGNQLYAKATNPFPSFFEDSTHAGSNDNRGRIQGRLKIHPTRRTRFVVLMDRDSTARGPGTVEANLISSHREDKSYPTDFSAIVKHDFQSSLTSTFFGVNSLMFTTEDLKFILGAEGSFEGSGTGARPIGEGGPRLQFWLSTLRAQLDLTGGYGSQGGFGRMTLSRSFNTESSNSNPASK